MPLGRKPYQHLVLKIKEELTVSTHNIYIYQTNKWKGKEERT